MKNEENADVLSGVDGVVSDAGSDSVGVRDQQHRHVFMMNLIELANFHLADFAVGYLDGKSDQVVVVKAERWIETMEKFTSTLKTYVQQKKTF